MSYDTLTNDEFRDAVKEAKAEGIYLKSFSNPLDSRASSTEITRRLSTLRGRERIISIALLKHIVEDHRNDASVKFTTPPLTGDAHRGFLSKSVEYAGKTIPLHVAYDMYDSFTRAYMSYAAALGTSIDDL